MKLSDIAPHAWATLGNSALAVKYGGTPERYRIHRKRHGLPPSIVKRGGDQRSAAANERKRLLLVKLKDCFDTAKLLDCFDIAKLSETVHKTMNP